MRESDLVAVRMPRGPAWRDAIEDLWSAGAALLPLDDRLTDRETSAVLAAARPTATWDGTDFIRQPHGALVEPGTALCVATGGTGGTPKMVELARAAVEAAVRASAARLEASEDDPWLACLPLSHMGGLLCVLRALLLGAQVQITQTFEPATDASFTSLVPAQLRRLLDEGADLARFRAILVGGDALPAALAARARDAGVRVVTTYGQTESCGGVVYDGVPLDGVGVSVEDGELVLDGPTLMRGYRGGAPLRPPLRTGDAGEIVEGKVRVFGRLDDVIVTGGEKVWPREVEDVLGAHPAVAEIAVWGEPDEAWGARVCATVVARGAPPTLEELQAFGRDRLAPYKLPRALQYADALSASKLEPRG